MTIVSVLDALAKEVLMRLEGAFDPGPRNREGRFFAHG